MIEVRASLFVRKQQKGFILPSLAYHDMTGIMQDKETQKLPTQIMRQTELAKRFGIHPETLRQWRKQGLPILAKKGGVVLFDVDVVLDWMNSEKSQGGAK